MSNDKLVLLFAAVERLAKAAGDSNLVEYLSHGSHHSGEFIDEVNLHHKNLDGLEEFTANHAALTSPASAAQQAHSYSKVEVDAMIKEAIKAAKASMKPAKPVAASTGGDS